MIKKLVDHADPSEIGSIKIMASLCLACIHFEKGVNFERSCSIKMQKKEVLACRCFECEGFEFNSEALPYHLELLAKELKGHSIDPATILK